MGLSESFTTTMLSMFSERNKIKNDKELKEYEDWLKAREKYREAVTEIRYGDFCDLQIIVNTINNYIDNKGENFDIEEANIIKDLLDKMEIPIEKLHPYEIPIMFDYRLLCNRLNKIISQ